MRIAKNWKDFEILDASGGERLERWGDILLIRPDPQVIWKTPRKMSEWGRANARYERSGTGGGQWRVRNLKVEEWTVEYGLLRLLVRPTGFKHTGLFPEQAANWDMLYKRIKASGGPKNILNLFAYTGGATLACAAAGASVCHVDASKGMVAWAKNNAAESRLDDKPVRWIVDDCLKFVQKEQRRDKRYDGIIMDPPSYGRGPSGELWRLEDSLFGLLEETVCLLHEESDFLVLNTYTTGFSPSVMRYMLEALIPKHLGGHVESWELGLPVKASGSVLPCGGTAAWFRD